MSEVRVELVEEGFERYWEGLFLGSTGFGSWGWRVRVREAGMWSTGVNGCQVYEWLSSQDKTGGQETAAAA